MARGTLVALLGFILLVSCICEIRSKQAESVEDDMLQEWEKSVKEFYTNREDDQRLKSELQEIEALFDSQDNVDLLTRDAENVTCVPCKRGTFANESKPECSNETCSSPGTCAEVEACQTCPNGTISNDKARNCSRCLAGTIAYEGEICLPCGKGEQANADQSNCTLCPPSTFNNETLGHCLPCPDGMYTNGTTSSDYVVCSICPGGTCWSQNSRLCSQCPAGTWSPTLSPGTDPTQLNNTCVGPDQCLRCPAGYYCGAGSSSPLQCPSGYYCPSGASTPQSCGFLESSKAGASGCNYDANFFVIISVLVLLVVILLVGIGCYSRSPSTTSNDDEVKESMIPEPLPGPVYGGY